LRRYAKKSSTWPDTGDGEGGDEDGDVTLLPPAVLGKEKVEGGLGGFEGKEGIV